MVSSKPKNKIYWNILLPLTAIKLLLHIFTNLFTEYGLHRDEYLYISESDHLDWGYMEVPPMIPIIGKVARLLFGDTEFAVRFFPALIGAISIIIVGLLVKELGGKKYAQLIASFAFLISPVYLGSNNLFQPVSFNQFMWLLSALVVVKIINDLLANNWIINKSTNLNLKNWYWLGIVAGLGFLTKYSIVFFFLGLIGGLLLSPYRSKIFLSKYPYISLGIALVIALPNLWWQYDHDFPIFKHMEELRATQLVDISVIDFLVPQFLSNFAASLVWVSGLVYVLFSKSLRSYSFLGWTYLLVILLLLFTSGKDYYAFGTYSMLFALGGVAWEDWLGKKALLLLPIIGLVNLTAFPLAMPILRIEKMEQYGLFLKNNLGMDFFLRWEDGTIHTIRQDYADMLGWEEIPEKVAQLYHSLTPKQQQTCLITAGHYGQAGVMNFYKEKYNLPETYSFNASFVAWIKEDLDITCQIQIDDRRQKQSTWFHSIELRDSIEHPYARDPGFIYFKSQPKKNLTPVWKELVRNEKRAAGY